MYPRSAGEFTTLVSDIRQGRKHPTLIWAFRYAVLVLLIAGPLSAPVILYWDDSGLTNDEPSELHRHHNLLFYIFLWLLISVLAGVVGDGIGVAAPYLFRVVTRSVCVS
jgi:hypothetical protein